MSEEGQIPEVRDIPGILNELSVRVGSTYYLFEQDHNTEEWRYVRHFTVSLADEDDPEPFDPSEYR